MERRKTVYITRPLSSGHKLERNLPLMVILKEVLKFARTSKDARYMIAHKSILLNGERVKEKRRAVGFLDVLSFPDLQKSYRMLIDRRGNLIMHEVSGEEAGYRPSKILNKTIIPGGKIQVNLDDGRNLLADKASGYATRDTLVISFEKRAVLKRLPFAKGMTAYITLGKHQGMIGILEDFAAGQAKVRTPDKTVTTPTNAVMIVGEKASSITFQG